MTPADEAAKLIREARHLISHPLSCNGPLCSMSKCDCTDYAVSDLLEKACQVLGDPDRGENVCQECGKEIRGRLDDQGSYRCSFGYNLCLTCCGRRK